MGLNKVLPGQRRGRPSADSHNSMLDAARAYQESRHEVSPGSPGRGFPGVVGKVRNNSGADWPQFAAVALRVPIILPADNLAEFQRQPALEGYTAEAADLTAVPTRVGVTLEPVPAGGVGNVQLSGVVPCQVSVLSAGDRHADLVPGQTYLQTATSGSVDVLWSTGTGTGWCLVRLGMQNFLPPKMQTYGVGVGDVGVSAFSFTTQQFQQSSGISIADAGGGVGSVFLLPAKVNHAGAVSLADQNLGTGTKGIADKLAVGFDVEAAAPAVWPGQTVLATSGGVLYALASVQSHQLACSEAVYGMDNLTARMVWKQSVSFGGGGTGRFQVDTYHWTGAAYANDNRIQLDGDGLNLQFGVYRFFGNNGQTGTFKTVTAQAGLVMGGTATGTGFSGTIGG
jgi:hypothetical protein